MAHPADDVDERFDQWRDRRLQEQAADETLTDLHKRGAVARLVCLACGYLWGKGAQDTDCPRCQSTEIAEDA